MIAGGDTVTDVAAQFGVARKTAHAWLSPYEAGSGAIEAFLDQPLDSVAPLAFGRLPQRSIVLSRGGR